METREYTKILQEEVNKKLEWFNSSCLQNMLNQYRLVHTCIKNLYDMLVRRSIIIDDPYRLDKRIMDIVVPESNAFSETEIPTIFGARLSDYETMLDFICTYFRFSVENIDLQKIKKLMNFNNFFVWSDVSVNSGKFNTRVLAIVLENARKGSDSVICSMISDSITKCGQTTAEINKELEELSVFQRELYKCELRKDLFEHPEFKKERAEDSAESELAEIKRLYTKVMGKKPFYNDLIGEIIKEDHGPDKEKRQQEVLKKLEIKSAVKKVVKKREEPDCKKMLMAAVVGLGVLAPIIAKLRSKLIENFDLFFEKKNTFINRLTSFLKKMFGIGDKKRVVLLPIKDAKNGGEKEQKIVVTEFLHELARKEHAYNGIALKGPEYVKIEGANEEAILSFLGKQISEMQATYNIIRSLDIYFKAEVEITVKVRLRGMQMELSTFRNAIINVNKKRGEYVSYREEAEQMKKLGIVDEDS